MSKKSISKFSNTELIVIIVIVVLLLAIVGVIVYLTNNSSSKKYRDQEDAVSSYDSAREKARRANCQGNLKQIGTAMRSYAISENLLPIYGADGQSNGTSALGVLIASGELTDYNVFVCPSSTTSKGTAPTGDNANKADQCANTLQGHVSYAYIPGIDSACGSVSGLAADGYVDSKTLNHTDFGNIMYGDGSVRPSTSTSNKYWIKEANWVDGVPTDWINSKEGPRIR